METQSLLIGIGLLAFGFVIGRLTSPQEKTTTVYQPIAGREITAADPQIEALLRAGQKIERPIAAAQLVDEKLLDEVIRESGIKR